MNFKFKTVCCLILYITTCCCTSKEENNSTSKNNQMNVLSEVEFYDNSLDFLKNINPSKEVKNILLLNPNFKNRLMKLVGERYSFMSSKWNYERSITINNDNFTAEICDNPQCNKTDFIIIYDFSKNNLSVGIREKGIAENYSENNEIPETILNWNNMH